jgi:hypothetical protein
MLLQNSRQRRFLELAEALDPVLFAQALEGGDALLLKGATAEQRQGAATHISGWAVEILNRLGRAL